MGYDYLRDNMKNLSDELFCELQKRSDAFLLKDMVVDMHHIDRDGCECVFVQFPTMNKFRELEENDGWLLYEEFENKEEVFRRIDEIDYLPLRREDILGNVSDIKDDIDWLQFANIKVDDLVVGFELDCYIPDDKTRILSLNDGTYLGIEHCDYDGDCFSDGVLSGACGYGNTWAEAWECLNNDEDIVDIKNALINKIDEFLCEDMTVEKTNDGLDIYFPSLNNGDVFDGEYLTTLNREELYSEVKSELNLDYLDGYSSIEELKDFCEANRIDVSDIYASFEYGNGDHCYVVFMDNDDFKEFAGVELKDNTPRLMEKTTARAEDILSADINRNIYSLEHFDKNGETINHYDNRIGLEVGCFLDFYGDMMIRDAVANIGTYFENENISIKKDLGLYRDIKDYIKSCKQRDDIVL